MADQDDQQTALEDQLSDIDLTQTDIGPVVNTPAPAAEDGTDDAAAAQDDVATDQGTKPDAADTTAKDKPADAKPQQGEGKPADGEDKPAEGDQQTNQDQSAQKTSEQLREEQQARARMEYQNRQRTRNQFAEQIDQNFGPKSQEELIAEGLPADDARIEALRQEIAYKDQRAAIAELNAGMQAEAVNAENDFPIYRQFNSDGSKNQDFDPEFTQMVENQYRQASRLQTQEIVDGRGGKSEIIVNAEVPLYDFYKQMYDIYNRGTSRGSKMGQQEMQEMMARTENPGGSSSTGSGDKNSLEELEARLGDVRIA